MDHRTPEDHMNHLVMRDLERCLKEVGSDGMTRHELAVATGIDEGTVGPGLNYLALEGKCFRARKSRRRGRVTGAPAIVWVHAMYRQTTPIVQQAALPL